MRREKDLADNVDVHSRTIAAKARVRTNGRHLHVPEPAVMDGDAVTLWERITRLFPQPEVLEVAGRVINKGIVLTPTMALTLFLALAGVMGTMYWRMSDTIGEQGKTINSQNELLIRLDQRLIEKDKQDQRDDEKMEKRLQNIDAVQIVLGRDLIKLQAQRGN